MPDPIIVDVQGIGPVEFPPGTSGAQIEAWVMQQLRQAGVPSQTWGQWLGNQAARVGGGIAGGLVGSLAGPVGTFAGTATGAAMGDEWAQSREVAQGVRGAVNPLEMVAAGVTAPIPGATIGKGPLLRQVPKALAAAVPGSAASSAGLQLAESGTVDPWRTAMETGRGAGLGTLMGVGIPASLRAGQSQAAQRLVRDETGAIRVYHGSPHDFDQFSTEKIGTGEGAQAYGHGLYFAEREGVAKQYRDALSDMGEVLVDDVPRTLNTESPVDMALLDLSQGRPDPAAIRRGFTSRFADDYEQAVQTYQGRVKAAIPGRMYEVDINADPEQFLDWDKPVSMQSPKVQEALATHGVKPIARDVIQEAEDQLADYWKEYDAALRKGDKGRIDIFERSIRQAGFDLERLRKAADMTGAAAYRDIGPQSDSVASQRLREAGVPGIRYLDQGSRDAGEGSRNYVVFDDQLVSILRKYGLLPFVPLSQVGRPQKDERKKK